MENEYIAKHTWTFCRSLVVGIKETKSGFFAFAEVAFSPGELWGPYQDRADAVELLTHYVQELSAEAGRAQIK